MLWNPFNKKPKHEKVEKKEEPKQEFEAVICYAIENDELYLEINIVDFSEKSLDTFAKLLAGVSTMSFVPDTLAVVKEALKDNPDVYIELIDKATFYAKKEIEKLLYQEGNYLDLSQDKDEPCIKPIDTLK